MISAEKVNEKLENKLSEKDREELINEISKICIGSSNLTGKEIKRTLEGIFNKESPLLDINAPITKMGKTNYSPLLLAAWFNKKEVIKELLLLGADLEMEGFNLLYISLSKADIKTIDHFLTVNPNLVNVTSDTGMNALMVAAEAGKKEIVKLLIEKYKVDIYLKDNEGKTCLDHAKEKNQKDIESLLMYYYLNNQLNNKETKVKVSKI